VSNWAEYDRALAQRGDITLWISADAADTWSPEPSRKRGGQREFSDQAIEAALMLRLVFPEWGEYAPFEAWLSYRYLPAVLKRGLLFPTPSLQPTIDSRWFEG